MEKIETRFHLDIANPMLVKHFEELRLKKEFCLFIPLSDKILEFQWF